MTINPERRQSAAKALLLIAITLLAYLPALRAGYVWDDREYVWGNEALRSTEGLKEIIRFKPTVSQAFPLVDLSFWLEYRVWGANPFGYHAGNVLLHIANSLLVWTVLCRLDVAGAFLAAAIFALHPVHVESVAWIAERKDVLCGLFYLLTVLVWLRYRDAWNWRRYGLALLCFSCAMLSKTMAVTLPAILVLLDWWQQPARWRRHLWRVVPLMLVSVGFGALSLRNFSGYTTSLSLVERILVAGRAVWFYAAKLLWPTNLMAIYPLWQINTGAAWQYAFPLAAVAVPILLWSGSARLGVGPLIAVVYFGATIAPVLGFSDFAWMGFSYVADRFQYLASIGLIALWASVVTHARARLGTAWRRVGTVAAGLVLLALAVLTWRQAALYDSVETLFRDNLAKNPDAAIAHFNIGEDLQEHGKLDEAIEEFAAVVRLTPDDPHVHKNWGKALEAQGKLDEAIVHYAAGVRRTPRDMTAHYLLGSALHARGDVAGAAEHFTAAVAAAPTDAALRVLLGTTLVEQGQVESAARHFAEAVRLNPDFAEAHSAWGVTLFMQGQRDAAIEHYATALRLNPNDRETREILDRLRAQ